MRMYFWVLLVAFSRHGTLHSLQATPQMPSQPMRYTMGAQALVSYQLLGSGWCQNPWVPWVLVEANRKHTQSLRISLPPPFPSAKGLRAIEEAF